MNRMLLPSASFTYISRVPHLVHGLDRDRDALFDKLRVQGIDAVHQEVDHAARKAVPGKR